MKIKSDFVTNSSSTCYIFDKRNLTKEELQVVREAGVKLMPPIYHGLGRASAYGEGIELEKYIRDLRTEEWMTDLADKLQGYLNKIGVDNIIFARNSDEDMGGNFLSYWPSRISNAEEITINKILDKAIHNFEYH